MKKTSCVALALLVVAAFHFRATSANKEIASKLCACIIIGMFT